jgi:HK97 family phage prohead protease/HK97 family phage major capsid protein
MNKKFEINSLFDVVEKEASDGSTLTIRGYANTVSKDRAGDVIVKEAWEKGALDDYLKNPIVLAFHDYSRPVGTTISHSVTDKGLEIVAEISKAAGEVYNLIKDGVLRTFSVGFSIKDADYDRTEDTFFIKDLSLYEISVVSVPANQDSTFSLSKAFDTEEAYKAYKDSYAPSTEVEATVTVVETSKEVSKEEVDDNKIEKGSSQDNILKDINMTQEEIQETMEQTAQKAVDAYKVEVAEKETSLKAEAELDSIKIGKSQAEKVVEALEAKIKDSDDNYAKAIEEMSAELKNNKDELAALAKSKMSFSEAGANEPTADELNAAYITSKITGKSVDQLSYGKKLIEKATRWADADWETTWNSNIFQGIQNRVVVEPVFQQMAMNARVMNFPFNPDTGMDATWVTTGNLNDGDAVGTAFNDASSGATAAHGLTEVTLTAHKLATREYIGYEEDEDSIIPIAGIVRDAIVRRMARTSDASILGTGQTAPFTELEELAGGHSGNNVTTGSTTDLFIKAELHTARTNMGQWGMNPADLVCFVSQAQYYSLVTDADVTTVDKYGDNATILTGELGKLWGIPLIVSDAFEAAAAAKAVGILVNPSNYLIGNHRGLTIEMATDVVAQQRAIVATRRFGFIAKEAGAAGKASMALILTAAS